MPNHDLTDHVVDLLSKHRTPSRLELSMSDLEGTQDVPSVELGKDLGQEVPFLFRNRTLTHGTRHFDPDLFFQGSRIPPAAHEGKVRSAARFEKPPAPNSFQECLDVRGVDFNARTVLEIGCPFTG